MLATDGVWEVMTAQEVVHFVQRWRKRPWQGWNASDALTLEAQERWKLLQAEVGWLFLWVRALCCPMCTATHLAASVLMRHAPVTAEVQEPCILLQQQQVQACTHSVICRVTCAWDTTSRSL